MKHPLNLNIPKLIVETLQNQDGVLEKVSIEEGLSLAHNISNIVINEILRKIEKVEINEGKKTIIFSETYEPFEI